MTRTIWGSICPTRTWKEVQSSRKSHIDHNSHISIQFPKQMRSLICVYRWSLWHVMSTSDKDNG